jgi:hypothetical protein
MLGRKIHNLTGKIDQPHFLIGDTFLLLPHVVTDWRKKIGLNVFPKIHVLESEPIILESGV